MDTEKVVFENGRFLRVRETIVMEGLIRERVIVKIEPDGTPVYAETTRFPQIRSIRTEEPATLLQWLTWKLHGHRRSL